MIGDKEGVEMKGIKRIEPPHPPKKPPNPTQPNSRPYTPTHRGGGGRSPRHALPEASKVDPAAEGARREHEQRVEHAVHGGGDQAYQHLSARARRCVGVGARVRVFGGVWATLWRRLLGASELEVVGKSVGG